MSDSRRQELKQAYAADEFATVVAIGEINSASEEGRGFRCEKCGMEIQVTSDCRCQGDDHVHFHCCGQELVKKS